MKIMEEGVGVCSLVHNILKGKRGVLKLRDGLKQMTSKLIIHIDLHKPNNKLVSA
jgi:hypothetical protein